MQCEDITCNQLQSCKWGDTKVASVWCGDMYNTERNNSSERHRELATLQKLKDRNMELESQLAELYSQQSRYESGDTQTGSKKSVKRSGKYTR